MRNFNLQQNTKIADVFKALGHPSRIHIVKKLAEGECTVGVFVDETGADFSTISQHLNVLKRAGVVTSERRGLNVYYSLVYPCIPWLIERMEYRDTLTTKEEALLKAHIEEEKAAFMKK